MIQQERSGPGAALLLVVRLPASLSGAGELFVAKAIVSPTTSS